MRHCWDRAQLCLPVAQSAQQASVLVTSSDWHSWAGARISAAPASVAAAGSFHLSDRSLPAVCRALAARSSCWACARQPAALRSLVQEVGMARQRLAGCGLPGGRQVPPGRKLPAAPISLDTLQLAAASGAQASRVSAAMDDHLHMVLSLFCTTWPAAAACMASLPKVAH
jgi:hypothetical protein